jgi:hypothetical protein
MINHNINVMINHNINVMINVLIKKNNLIYKIEYY